MEDKKAAAEAKAEAAARVATEDEGTLVSVRLSKPGAFLDATAEIARPGYAWRPNLDKLSSKAAVAVDWNAPVRVVVGARKEGEGNRVPVVASMGITSRDNVKAALAELSVPATGEAFTFDPWSCEIGERRMVCWTKDRASAESWIARIDEGPAGTEPELVVSFDSAGIRGPFSGDVEKAWGMLPMLTSSLNGVLTDKAFAKTAEAAVTDSMMDFREFVMEDFGDATIRIKPRADKSGIGATMDVNVPGTKSTVARLLFRNQVAIEPPPEFWALPAKVAGAGYTSGGLADEETAARLRARARELVLGGVRELGLEESEVATMIDGWDDSVITTRGYAWAELPVVPKMPNTGMGLAAMAGADLEPIGHRLMVGTPALGRRDPFVTQMVAYMNRADVRSKFTARVPVPGTFEISEGPDATLGERGWSSRAKFSMSGLPAPVEVHIMGTTTGEGGSERGWMAMGHQVEPLREAMLAAMSGGATLKDDPLAQAMRGQTAAAASMYPISAKMITDAFSSLGLPALDLTVPPGPPSAFYSRVTYGDRTVHVEMEAPAAGVQLLIDVPLRLAQMD